MVLVDESAARGASFDPLAWADRDDIGGVVGCALVDSAMGAVLVVVLEVRDNQGSELFLVPNDFAVAQFVSNCAGPSFGVGVRTGRPWGIRITVIREPANTASKDLVNCRAPSRMRYRNPWSSRSLMRKLRAVWVVHAPVGLVEIPARCTRRVWISMTNRTWNLRRNAVSTHAKSVAMIPAAWDLMNSIHVGPVRSRAGSMPAAPRIFHTVDAAIWWPSRVGSPWIRR